MSYFTSTSNEGVPGIKPQVTSDELLNSPSNFPCVCFQIRENLTLDQVSLRALFHAPAQIIPSRFEVLLLCGGWHWVIHCTLNPTLNYWKLGKLASSGLICAGYHVVFSENKFSSTMCFSTQVCKWY